MRGIVSTRGFEQPQANRMSSKKHPGLSYETITEDIAKKIIIVSPYGQSTKPIIPLV